MLNGGSYLDRRDAEIDRSEWVDIEYGIRAVVGEFAGYRVVELCAGKGYLIEYLRSKYPGNQYVGVDLEGCRYSEHVVCMDLNKQYPPSGDIYVFQHCIEHLDQNRVIDLLRYCLKHGLAVVGVAPGHRVGDLTHVVNHYHYEDLIKLVRKTGAKHFFIRPDLLSYVSPKDRDWLIILSNKPVDPRKTYPLFFRLAHGLLRRVVRGVLG